MHGLDAASLLEYMLSEWRDKGPGVLLLEGFSGVGKSNVGNALLRAWDTPKCMVSIPPGGEDLESLLFDIAASLEISGYSGVADADQGDFRLGIEQNFMGTGGLIVIDDAEEELERNGGSTSAVLEYLSVLSRRASTGRVLLLSSMSPKHEGWPLSIQIKTMAPPSSPNAQTLLLQLLRDRGLDGEVPHEKLRDVAQWLGNNPRAMQAFVACLLENPLDELIELDDDAWERRDDAPSPSLVNRLETLFLTKTLERLPADASVLLENLSVYRKPVTLEAMKAIAPGQFNMLAAKDELQRRFLMHRDRKWYSLNPIARQLANSRLRQSVRLEQRAHTLAADFFRKRAVPGAGRSSVATGSDFIEAKYHLHKSGRASEYQDLAASHRELLLQNYKHIRTLPVDQRERDFLLATLGSILEDESWTGYAKLRSLLARLLVERNVGRDSQRALRQITLCCRESLNVADWLLRAALLAKHETVAALRSLGLEAIETLAWTNSLQVLLRLANLLSARGEDAFAFELLSQNMSTFPATERQPLYTAAAFALARGNAQGAAVDFLVNGYADLTRDGRNRHRLFEEALFLAFQRRDVRGMERIKALVIHDGRNEFQAHLCQSLIHQLQGDYASATMNGVARGKYFALDCQAAFAYLCVRDVGSATRVLSAGRKTANSATLWLEGLLALCQGNSDVYREAMLKASRALGAPLEEVDAFSWLQVWDQDPVELDPFPAFYFPVLPSSLTGLTHDLVHQSGSEVTVSVSESNIHLPIAGDALEKNDSGHDAGGLSVVVNNNYQASFQEGNNVGGTYNVGQAGAVGDGASVSGSSFTYNQASQVDWVQALDQLRALAAAMKSADSSEVELVDADVVEVEAAVEEIRSGKTSAAEGRLARLGLATLQFARDIGVDIAAAVIQRATGLA